MQTIQTLEQLIEYKKKLERQSDCLSLDTLWSIADKNRMLQCYCEMIAICENKIIDIEIDAINHKLEVIL